MAEKSDSRTNISEHSSEKLLLALNQASDSLGEAMATRRAVDTKIYELMALSLTLLALLITIRPWSSWSGLGGWFYVLALVAYGITVALGFWKYKSVESHVPDARAIIESLDSSYLELVKWTTEDLLDFVDENYDIAHRKALAHSKMWCTFLVATAFLILGALLY
jgi:hypothetical protein